MHTTSHMFARLRPSRPPASALGILVLALLAGCAPTHLPSQSSGSAPALLDPGLATGDAPEEYSVKLFTTGGVILIDVTRAWAPRAADRFYDLVEVGYYDNTAFLRVIGGYLAQFGHHGDPRVQSAWTAPAWSPDARRQSNEAGTVGFARELQGEAPTEVLISVKDNPDLDSVGVVPFGRVRSIEVADNLYFGYAELAPAGKGPDRSRIRSEGNAYLMTHFPELDWVLRARVVIGPSGGFAGPQPPQRSSRRRSRVKIPRPSAPAGPAGGGGRGGGHSH